MIAVLAVLAVASAATPAAAPTAAEATAAPAAPPAADPVALTEPVPEPAPDLPDRSHPPEVQEPPRLPLPDPVVTELHPGVTAWYIRVPGVRKVFVDVDSGQGAVELLGRWTAESQAAGWLPSEATSALDSSALAEKLELLEAELGSTLGNHEAGAWLQVPAENLAEALPLLTGVVREPAMAKSDLKRWALDRRLFYEVNGPSSQAALARAGLTFAWWGADHPYGARPDPAAFKKVKPEAARAIWDRAWRSGPVTVVVVGDVAWEAVSGELAQLTEGLGVAGARPSYVATPAPTADRVLAVELPGQSQVAIKARWAAPAYLGPDFGAFSVANFVMGGAFLSRLNSNLREEKGFTYGCRTEYNANRSDGSWTIGVDVKAVNLAATITEIEKEAHRIASEPITPEELTAARRGFAADWNRQLQSAETALSPYENAIDQVATMAEFRSAFEARIGATVEDVGRVSAAWLGDDRPVTWILVGDRAAVDAQLQQLGRTATWVTAADAIVGNF